MSSPEPNLQTKARAMGQTDPSIPKILFSAPDFYWPIWEGRLTDALAEAGVAADLARAHPPEEVDWIVYAPSGPLKDFSPFTRAKAVLNLWAGVETVIGNPTLTQPLARMVEPGLRQGMMEWVAGHVLRHHLGMDAHLAPKDRGWHNTAPALAGSRRVTILGLGELGVACAKTLRDLGFAVTGWSRSPKAVDGVRCLHGRPGFATALAEADVLVLLLPLTDATEAMIDAGALARLPQGAVLLNPGRGGLIDDDALLAALDAGRLAHATLDTFRVEPLPQDHPFWDHPGVTITPHIASATRASTAAPVIAENIRRGEAGLPLMHLVDRARGY